LSSWSNCEGTVDFGGRVKYAGQWKKGKEHGQGTLIFTTGSKYVGEFKDGKRNGQMDCSKVNPDGRIAV